MKFESLPWSLGALVHAAIATADSLPYNPTRILSAANSSYIYLFEPSPRSPNQGVLKSLDITKEFATSSMPWQTVTDGLPFLQEDSPIPYTPLIDQSGNITVIAGSCTAGADKTQVWQFAPASDGTGAWQHFTTSDQHLAIGSNLTGSNYLANGIAFSADVHNDAANTDYFLFGGMCPFSSADASDWVSNAAYSDNMLAFTPEQWSDGEGVTYDITSVASRGPAIAEAGFSMTGLNPSYSMNASGSARSRQQDFLLLGGHTQRAFINMSNVALFSLPQESWSFVSVSQYPNSKTDLAVRQDATAIEPRSGHTAILTEDGDSVIAVGGWVGDVTNAAQPQIAILNLGAEYGGDESTEWTWSTPSSNSTSAILGGGIYGHGATLLPGGIMIIAGGYSIAGSSSPSKRDSQTTNTNVYLYNTTSDTWIDSYSPLAKSAAADTSSSSGALSKTSQQAGLGVGLGVGALGLAGLICFYFWYSRRLKRRREERERQLLDGNSKISVRHFAEPFLDRGGIDGRGGKSHADNASPATSQAGTTGLWTNIPSPTRGLRKGLSARPYMYHAAPRHDERRTNQNSGSIHPILERADEDGSIRSNSVALGESRAVQPLPLAECAYGNDSHEAERLLRDPLRLSKARAPNPPKNPFGDPQPNPLRSHPVSPAEGETVRRVPTGASRYDRSPTRRPLSAEMESSMNWMLIDEPDALSDPSSSSSNGRVSPTKSDERTSSILSERSQTSSTSITRTMSTRTGALLAAALAARRNRDVEGPPRSPVDERTSTMGTMSSLSGRASPYYFYNADRAMPGSSKQDSLHAAQRSADSFKTAKTSLAQLQDEGQMLLGGRPVLDRDDPYQRAMAATSPNMAQQSATYGGPPISSARRRPGLMGSLRRALTIISNSERSLSLTGSAVERCEEEAEAEAATLSSLRIRSRKNGALEGTRRTVSDGDALLKHRRGESDWDKEKDYPNPYRDDPDPGDWGERRTSADDRAAENEWDVEGAVSRRDVQVMFTVPKARLRVVNADVERASMRSASDSAMSRAGSVTNPRTEDNLQTLRSRTDEKEKERERDRVVVPLTTTMEEAELARSTARELHP